MTHRNGIWQIRLLKSTSDAFCGLRSSLFAVLALLKSVNQVTFLKCDADHTFVNRPLRMAVFSDERVRLPADPLKRTRVGSRGRGETGI